MKKTLALVLICACAVVSAAKGEKNYGMRMVLFDDINLAMQKMNKKDIINFFYYINYKPQIIPLC